tara:strand:- start:1167 stop:1439 length:273 start_codon:yes stop_codon:yes gene_type:complete
LRAHPYGAIAQLVERLRGTQEVRSSSLLGSISTPGPGDFDVSFPYVFVDRRLGNVLTEAFLKFLDGAADISSGVSHVRLATEAEVVRLFN